MTWQEHLKFKSSPAPRKTISSSISASSISGKIFTAQLPHSKLNPHWANSAPTNPELLIVSASKAVCFPWSSVKTPDFFSRNRIDILIMNVWEGQVIAAISQKDSDLAIRLLRQGFPVNYSVKIRNSNGISQSANSTLLIESISGGLRPLSEYLLANGCNLNSVDSLGRSPVQLTCCIGDLETLQMLIKHNVDTGVRDALGNTILHTAAMNKHLAIVEYLVEIAKFPVVVLNKLMQRPLELCKAVQENSKSLNDIEELEVIIQYLWRTEEEYKKNFGNSNKNSPQKVWKMRTRSEASKTITISPFSKQITCTSPFKGRQTIQNYLQDKHRAIHKRNEGKLALSTFSQYSMRSPSPGLKLPLIKKLTN